MNELNEMAVINVVQSICQIGYLIYNPLTKKATLDKHFLTLHNAMDSGDCKIEILQSIYAEDSYNLLLNAFLNKESESIEIVTQKGRRMGFKMSTTKLPSFGSPIKMGVFQVLSKSKAKELGLEKILIQFRKDMDIFIHVASHDLRTPLRTITSFLNLIEIELEKETFNLEELTGYLNFAKEGSENIYQVVQGIETYLKIKRNKLHQNQIFQINDVLDRLENDIERKYASRNIKITRNSFPEIYGNESQFILLFYNLLDNAVKFNNNKNVEINIQYKRTKDALIFSFVDNGIGIKAEYCNLVFEMFKKLHSTTEYEGIGMGLALCKSVIDKYRGSISVCKGIENGSCLTISLPESLLVKSIESAPMLQKYDHES